MRFPIQSRLSPRFMAVFIAVMFIGQIVEGTDIFFAILTAAYLVLWTLAFNVAGGLEYASGAFVFSNGLFSVVIGFGAKILLGEPGQRNLKSPNTTLVVYTVSMLMTLIVVVLVRQLRPPRGLLKGFDNAVDMQRASYFCFFVGWGLSLLTIFVSASNGSLLSALRQVVTGLPFMAIIFGTIAEIRASGGKRSMSLVVKVSILGDFLFALIFFSKEGMLIGFLAWGFAAFSEGYSFKWYQLVAAILGFSFFTYYLAPYSQYVRDHASESHSVVENTSIAIYYLSDLNETRRLDLEQEGYADQSEGFHLYDEPVGFLDRLIQVAADDYLIDYTTQGHVYGLMPTYMDYANVVPHFIWHDKDIIGTGNVYAREMGLLPESDTTTGISFAASADAFHQGSWLGILLLLPFDLFILFIAYDSIFGNVRDNSFALLPILFLFESGAASGLTGPVSLATTGLIGILGLVFLVKVVGSRVVALMMPSDQSTSHVLVSAGESIANDRAGATV